MRRTRARGKLAILVTTGTIFSASGSLLYWPDGTVMNWPT